MKFGFLGFAHVHAAGYAQLIRDLDDAELVGIADPDESRLGDAVARYGGDPYPDHRALLQRDDLDAVVVMSETARHRELVEAAAAAGKHVLCEKPIATSREDGVAMLAACRAAGVKFQTIFPTRFNPPAIALRRAVRDESIGRPLAVKATNPGKMPPGWFGDPALAGGGAVMDHVVHVADLLRWTFDQEVVRVYAEVDTRLHAESAVDDVGVLMLTLSDGLTASLDASWSRPATWPTWGGLTMEVVGERGVIAMDAGAEVVELFDDREPRHALVSWGSDSDRRLLQAFIDAVRDDTAPPITGEDGLRAMEVALCAYESAKRGEPVDCPECLADGSAS